MGNFLLHYMVALVILPIPIGLFWVWVYLNGKPLGLPDWFLGILGEGIVSWHDISSGNANPKAYKFIFQSTLITTFIVVGAFYAITGGFSSKSESVTSAETWYAGMGSSDFPNVVASEVEGNWIPAPGYSWTSDDPNDFTVIWVAGMEHRDFPNILASETEGTWGPAPGYRWVYPDDPNDWQIEPDN